jgi:uncharacterized membrane protein
MDVPSSSVPVDTFETRRARWAAAGAAADERLRQQAVIVAVLLACAFLTAFVVVLYVG